MERNTTKVTRSWGATAGYLIGALVALALSVLLFMTIAEGPFTFGVALMPGIVGVILLFMAFGGSGAGACPVCGAPLAGLSTKSNDGVLCRACHNYVEGEGGQLWQTDAGRVAESPLFSSPLPDKFKFPEVCNVCGAPETAREKITMRMQNASSAITAPTAGLTSATVVSVSVPRCAEHEGGAILTGTPDSTHIKFRSYPYLRAFCQLNGTTPG